MARSPHARIPTGASVARAGCPSRRHDAGARLAAMALAASRFRLAIAVVAITLGTMAWESGASLFRTAEHRATKPLLLSAGGAGRRVQTARFARRPATAAQARTAAATTLPRLAEAIPVAKRRTPTAAGRRVASRSAPAAAARERATTHARGTEWGSLHIGGARAVFLFFPGGLLFLRRCRRGTSVTHASPKRSALVSFSTKGLGRTVPYA